MNNIPQVHKLSRASQLSLVAVVILLGAIFFTVNGALQQHNTAGHASGGTNILLNPSFENGKTNWFLYVNSPASASFTTTTNTAESGANSAQVTIYQGSSNNWDVQLQESNLPITAGQTYTVSFWAKASANRHIEHVVQQASNPYTVYAYKNFNITTYWQQYTYTFTAPASQSNTFFGFNLADATGTVWFDNVSLIQGGTFIQQPTSMPTAVPTLVSTQTSAGSAPITSDFHSSAQVHSWTSSVSWNQTVGTHSDRLLILGIAIDNGKSVSTYTPPTFGSQTFTRLSNKIYKYGIEDDELWYLKNPTPGTAPITVHFTGYADSVAGSASFYNVDQSKTFGTVVSGSCDCNTSSISVPSGSNQVIVDSLASDTINGNFHPAYGQTQFWNAYPNTPQNGFSSKPSVGSTTTMKWTDGSTDNWADIGVALLPVVVVPTATPTPKPTAVPPTLIPTPTLASVSPTQTPGTSATPLPTVIPTETPAAPGSTILAINVGLHGIGNGGDSASPNSQGNMHPLRPTRTVTADIYDTQNKLVVSQQGTMTYNSTSGRFNGTINLGNSFQSGPYTVKIKTDQYLRALVPGIQTITSGQTNTLPDVTLIAGDINGDNAINIVDYNILIGCYSDLLPATNCNATNNVLADLNDDGHVNEYDYNLFLRELTNIGGQ